MALSKLVIGLIAGIGSVVAIGGITAGVVVSRQNSTQTVETTDEFKEPNRNESLKINQPRNDSSDHRTSTVETKEREANRMRQTEEALEEQSLKSTSQDTSTNAGKKEGSSDANQVTQANSNVQKQPVTEERLQEDQEERDMNRLDSISRTDVSTSQPAAEQVEPAPAQTDRGEASIQADDDTRSGIHQESDQVHTEPQDL